MDPACQQRRNILFEGIIFFGIASHDTHASARRAAVRLLMLRLPSVLGPTDMVIGVRHRKSSLGIILSGQFE